MFKKTFNIMLSALCCTALLTACGGSSSSNSSEESTEETANDGTLKVTPETASIGGKFGKAFDIDDRDYTLKIEDGWGGDKEAKMSITVTRNDVKPSVNFDEIAGSHDAGKKYVGDIEAEFLDENEDVLFTATIYGYTDIDKLLTLEEGDKTTITVSAYEKEDVIMKAKKFRLTSKLENNSHAGKPGSVTDDLEEQMDALGKAADAVGAMVGAAAKAAEAADEINKR
ncbi:MAG: hypothetical protein PUB55_07660 [Bacteroidales bacterium]|nr:hypothetical protein [Bacteroidales bacterium]